jgi:acyl transferase domain-containing protein/NAD(P)-dependent dehydrogenase (short-subunit alcohol dehydrogenase family)
VTNEEQTRPVPVAIIGIGCLFPKADNVESYWANLQDGVDAIGEVPATHWRPEDYFDKDPKRPDFTYAARGGFLSPVDFPALELGISPNVLEATDSTQLLGLLAAKQALEVAGYGAAGKAFDRNKVSVILGVTGTLELVIPLGARLGHPHWKRALKEAGVEDSVAADVVQRIADSYVGWQEDSFPGLLGNVVAGRIANRLDLGGTNCVVDAACASSLSAMHLALLELAAGRSDMAIAGGMDTFNDIFMYMCFSKTPALSPTGDSRPFDTKADGTILGEGLGCVLLKRLADAERDGDTIYAVIRSIGTSSDGKGQAIYAPAPKGQAKALRQAYRLAGVTPESIELVEAHGTGTRAGDAAEVTALNEVYRNGVNGDPIELPPAPWCAIGSVKSQIGHTKAAAGIAGLIKATLALYHKVLPPTIKVAQPIEQVSSRSPFYVNTEKRPWMLSRTGHPRRAAVSAFGFGGSNFHCVLEEHGSQKPSVDWDANVQILAFSAQTPDELRQRLNAIPLANASGSYSWDDVRIEAARCRARFFGKHRYRLTMVVERGKKEPSQLIASAVAMLDKSPDVDQWTTPDGIYFSRGNTPGKLAMIFPGQGSQYVGMMRDLSCRWPQLQTSLIEANAMFARHRAPGDARLSDFIYPQSVFRDEDRLRNEDALRATDVAQPALGALSIGAMRVLEHFHVQPDAVAGHSYGELTALCAAGWIDAPSLHMLSHLRGRLMASGVGDRGGMLAVQAPLAAVESVIKDENLDLVLANRNAPNQAVLSGSSLEIERAREIFGERKIGCRSLPVAAAFHSSFVADAKRPFLDALEKIAIHPSATPVYANTTALEYPRDPKAIRNLLAGQLAEPVRFVEEIESLYASGVRTFIEVGPGNKLSGLIGAILEGRPHDVLALDASNGKRPGFADLARVIAPLAAFGHRVELNLWDEGQADKQTKSEKKPTLTVPICGANYVKPKEVRPAAAAKPKTVAPAPTPPVKPSQSFAAPRVQPANPGMPKTMNEPVPTVPTDSNAMRHSLAMTQENLLALQKLAEQTAQLHQQFLEGQDRTLQVFQSLLEQQNALLAGRPAMPIRVVESTPAPVVAKPRQVSVASAPVAKPKLVAPIPAQPAPVSLPERNGTPIAISRMESTLLDVVAAKTGYPAEMLQLDMELDTDLGIDSIKRVEIFALLQEKLPDAPPVKAEHLGTLRTLRNVVEFLGESLPAPSERGAGGEGETVVSPATAPKSDEATSVFLDVVAQKTGYPPEMLQLDMELDTDLGIDSIKRVEIFSLLQEKLPNAPTVKAEHLGTLRTIRHVIDFIAASPENNGTPAKPHDDRSASSASAPAIPLSPNASPPEHRERREEIQRLIVAPIELDEQLPRESVTLPANGEIWINGDDSELALRISRRLELLGYRPRIVSLDEASAPSALAGLLLIAPEKANDAFLQRTFHLLQVCAAGLRASGGVFATVSRLDGSFGLSRLTDRGDAITGGLAGMSKTASHEWPEVHCKAIDLAPDWQDQDEAAFAIVEEMLLSGPLEVGLTPGGRCSLQLTPTPQDATSPTAPLNKGDVVVITGGARGVTAETAVALARAFAPTLVLLGRSPLPSAEPTWLAPLTQESDIKRALMADLNGQATLKEVGDRYRSVLANREVLANLERIQQAGSRVVYRQVDVRDANAVRAMVGEIRAELGPIKGLVHGAGVLADRRIEDKTREQFEMVYQTKVAGLQALLEALHDDDLRVLALFSSSTGRFGRTGQVDYAVANEVLNKLALREAQRRPRCKVVSFNWGPWDGGMVNASLKKVFASEGVGTIPLQGGADYFVREICQPINPPVEVVVLGTLEEAKPALGAADTIAFERDISVETMPVLRSHVIKGHSVVPMALIAEWLAHGALHANPGLAFHGFDHLQVLKGVILNDEQPAHVRVLTGKAAKSESFYRVPMELRSSANGRDILHARAEIVLAKKLPASEGQVRELTGPAYSRNKTDVYGEFLFHGLELQGIEQVETCTEEGIAATVASAPLPSEWIEQPMRSAWLADPLVLDCAFQLMIVWSQETHGAGSLPTSAGHYRQYQRAFPIDGIRVIARVTKQTEHRALADIDFVDRAGKLIARMTDYECVIDPSLNQAFRGNRLGMNATPSL